MSYFRAEIKLWNFASESWSVDADQAALQKIAIELSADRIHFRAKLNGGLVLLRLIRYFTRDSRADQASESFSRLFSILKATRGFGDFGILVEIGVRECTTQNAGAANSRLNLAAIE